MLLGAATARPRRDELGDNRVTKLVAGARERERDVRMQALEASGTWKSAADAPGMLRSQSPLLLVGAGETAR
jgi:hypothetical protein